MLAIYHKAYGDNHYLVGIATSNLANTYTDAKQFTVAEPLFRKAVAVFTRAQGPQSMNTGIARIKLGRTLLGLHRHRDALAETLAGYQIVSKQAAPTNRFLTVARKDLVKEYEAMGEAQKAEPFSKQLASLGETVAHR